MDVYVLCSCQQQHAQYKFLGQIYSNYLPSDNSLYVYGKATKSIC